MANPVSFPGARQTDQGVDLDTDAERDGVQVTREQVAAFRRMPNAEADRFMGTLTQASWGALEAAYNREAMLQPPGQRMLLRDRLHSESYRRHNEGRSSDEQVRTVRVGATGNQTECDELLAEFSITHLRAAPAFPSTYRAASASRFRRTDASC